MSGRGRCLTVVYAMTSVNSIHGMGIHKDENDEGVDGTLLCEPEAEWESTELKLIEWFNEDNTKKVGDDEPEKKQYGHQAKIIMPMSMCLSFLIGLLVWLKRRCLTQDGRTF